MEEPYSRVYAQIDLDAIEDNIKAMAGKMPAGTSLIGVIKTDGYGHGAVPVAQTIAPYVWGYASATLEEAIILQNHGIKKPILVLGSIHERQFGELLNSGIRPSVFELSKAECLSDLAVKEGKKVPIHIAVDTGMSRIGFFPDEESVKEIEAINKLPGIEIEGLFTHFSRADESDRSITESQFEAYQKFAQSLSDKGIHIPMKHCGNSAAILDYRQMGLDAMRAGIAIYGLYPSDEVNKDEILLKAAMEIRSFITYVKEIKAGTPVSYGGTYVAEHDMKVATVGVGYGDGYPRNLSGKGEVLIRGKRAPILGRICMDQFMVDVSHIPEAKEDDRVTLVGRDGEENISMEELAIKGGGFHYEIPCVLGKRVPRVYIKKGKMIGKKDYHNDRYEDFFSE